MRSDAADVVTEGKNPCKALVILLPPESVSFEVALRNCKIDSSTQYEGLVGVPNNERDVCKFARKY